MKLVYLFCAFMLLNLNLAIMARNVEKNVMILYQEERLNGKLFSEKIQVVDGNKKYVYGINGTSVSYEEYLEELLESEMIDRKKERDQERTTRTALIDSYQKARNKIEQQELKYKIKELEQELSKVNENRLKNYMVFAEDTFNSYDELEFLTNRVIPEAYILLSERPEDLDIKELHKAYQKIDSALPKVRHFFAATINNAVEKSDDTKMLKELLNLIA